MKIRLATILVGIWIGMSVAMWLVAAGNFATVDKILEPGYRPELSEQVAPRTLAEERPIIRYLASELNRLYFHGWAKIQLAFIAMLLALVMTGPPGRVVRITAASVAVSSALVSLWLAPVLARLGPILDFVPRPVPPEFEAVYGEFMQLHGLYMGIDLLKLVLLLVLAILLLREPKTSAGNI